MVESERYRHVGARPPAPECASNSSLGAGDRLRRIVAGLPVCVTDDVDATLETAARTFEVYGTLVNYQRILAAGGISSPAQAAIVGDEASVAAQLEELVDAGATDVWAAPFPVGDDKRESLNGTRRLLVDLAGGN